MMRRWPSIVTDAVLAVFAGAVWLLVIASAVALLTGCTTKYVRVYCLTQEQFNELKAEKPGKIRDRLTGKAEADIRPIAGRLIRVEAYADGLLDVLGGCVGK